MNEHLLWDLMSAYSDTLTRRSKHLASPMLLTSSGPLTSRHSWPRDHLSIPGIRPIRSLRVSRGLCAPGLLIIRSTRSNWVLRGSYPEGNFGGNQLLDHSISLSPLCASLDIDLHVRTSSDFQRPFGRLHLRSRKGRGLSGPSEVALTHIFQKSELSRVVDGASQVQAPGLPTSGGLHRPLLSLRARVFSTQTLATAQVSLVRVSRRAY